MPELIDPEEQNWLNKLKDAGALSASGQNYSLRSAKAWDDLIKGSGLLQFPGNLGYDPELQNYVLFDFYETSGESVNKDEQASLDTSRLTESEREALEEQRQASGRAAAEVIERRGQDVAAQSLIKTIGDRVERSILGNINFQVDPSQLTEASAGLGLFSYNSVRLGFANKIKRSNISVALPMPGNIKSNYELEYEETDFSGFMNLIAAKDSLRDMAVNGNEISAEGKEVVDKLVSIPTSILDSVSEIFGKGSEGGLNFNQASQLRKRKAPNSFKDQIFKGVKRRTFSFEWDLSPRSIQDVMKIQSILFAFKKYSHPKRSEGGLYLDYPGQFKIGFYNKDKLNDFLFRIGLCACTKCELTYGGDELNFMRSFEYDTGAFSESTSAYGAPATTVKLSLDFSELELLTRERIDQGY